jgi:hypothetical protein
MALSIPDIHMIFPLAAPRKQISGSGNLYNNKPRIPGAYYLGMAD